MVKAKKSENLLGSPEGIKKLAQKKGVTIFIDGDPNSQETNMGHTFTYSRQSKILTIIVNNISNNDRKLVTEIIKETFEKGELIFKKSKEKVLESYNKYHQDLNKTDEQILDFFKGIIPHLDYLALKMALFIRYQKEQGLNISVLKADISNKFGERGANIANLCSTGFFENEFRPLFNLLERDEFDEYYELAVGKKSRALFVHNRMAKEEVEIEFQRILTLAHAYHLPDFRVYGLGKHNVQTIKDFFAEKQADLATQEPNLTILIRKEVERTQPFYVIEYIINIY